jgi:endonuclease/exonuclease/phosphatase family metal-dependent hydrolase
MKLLLYNVCYCMGVGNGYKDYISCNKNIVLNPKALNKIANFIKKQKPNIVGLVEVDMGSIRSHHIDQSEHIKNKLGFNYIASFCKYGNSKLGKLPYFKHMANSIISKNKFSKVNEHYFKYGKKKLVIEVEIDSRFVLYLVHLSLTRKSREKQIKELAKIVSKNKKPKIVLGDFNTFKGDQELIEFMRLTGMNLAEHNLETFPAWDPKKCLDHVLYSKNIKINKIHSPIVNYSDHLPIIVDFNCKRD